MSAAQAIIDARTRRFRQIDRLISMMGENDPYTTVFVGCDPGDAAALLERRPDAVTTVTVYGDTPDDPHAFVIATVEVRIGRTTITAHHPRRPATQEERRQLVDPHSSVHNHCYRASRVGGST